jgi:hypothetical protein
MSDSARRLRALEIAQQLGGLDRVEAQMILEHVHWLLDNFLEERPAQPRLVSLRRPEPIGSSPRRLAQSKVI